MDLLEITQRLREVINEISKIYVGKKDLVKLAVATLFSGGHLLIEGYPGTGKTLLAKALAKVIGGEYRRVQGHPDILPSDILGFHIYRVGGERIFVKGPVFTNILLFDEINRVSSRAQSALLEAMQEYQVTIDGVTYPLQKPFLVIATQVSQRRAPETLRVIETLMDRFSVSLESFYNPPEEEIEILEKHDSIATLPVSQILAPKDVLLITENISKQVYVDRSVAEYIVRLVNYIRRHSAVEYGPSHRAAVDIMRLSRVLAALDNRDYVIPDDVKSIFVQATRHRFKIRDEYELEGVSPESISEEALKNVSVPK